MTEREQTAHRRLSVLPGPFTEAAAAAILDADTQETEDTLVELVHRSMLARVGAAEPGRPTTFRQLVTVRSHARHDLRKTGAVQELDDRRDDFTTELLGRRPPLGTTAEPGWYHSIDDDHATVRATLTRRLIDQPTPDGALLAAQLPFYWYYRGRLVEATRWLTLGHDLLLDGDPHDLTMARLAVSAILTLQGRHDQARPYVDAAIAFPLAPGDPRVDPMIEVLVGLVGAAWITENKPLVVEMNQHLVRLVENTSSAHLRLLVDAVGAMAVAAGGQQEAAIAQAVEVQQRAATAGVSMASWLVSGAPMAYALYSRQPEFGIPWVERCMADHFPSGTGAGGAFIETRANYAAQQGDFLLAARLYGAARSTTRRVGMRWPLRDLTLELIELTKSGLTDREFEQYWRAGQTLSPLQVLDGLRDGWPG